MKSTFSLIAGILCLLAFVPYIWAILKGETKPSKATWLIWVSLDSITLYGMYLERSLNGQIIGAAIGSLAITVLAMVYGTPGYTRLDECCFAAAVISIGLMFYNPQWAMLASLAAIFVGAFPTFRSAWKDPSREDKLAWTTFFLSCLFAMGAIPKWTVEDAAQPVTFLVIESVMMYLLYVRPAKVAA